MQTRQLGRTDLHLTPLGFGAWAIGGGNWVFGWGSQDDRDSIAAIREALELGINWIDTAAVYGLGRSEEVVARALEGVSPRPLIFTKCGRVWNERREVGKDISAASIRRECEASLRRLGVETIDLYQIHWPEPDERIEEGWTEINRLRTEGKVRVDGADYPLEPRQKNLLLALMDARHHELENAQLRAACGSQANSFSPSKVFERNPVVYTQFIKYQPGDGVYALQIPEEDRDWLS